jgi:arylsulfatase A-like enzyme
MKLISWLRLGLVVQALALMTMAVAAQTGVKRPNILLIVADDLGYNEIGAFGSEIRTPNLDQLASQGIRLGSFYASPFCSPTRAMLISGADNHQVGFGAMTELIPAELRKRPGYQGYLNERAVPFPALLRQAGYKTYMTGKWHLGVPPDADPTRRGFDRAYALLQGGGGHFDQTGTIAVDPASSPKVTYREDGKEVDLPKDFYSSEFFAKRLIEYIESGRAESKPFFAYLAFTAPHWPLQARDEDIARYDGVYDVGYDQIRQRRLERMKASGLIAAEATYYPGHPAWPRWDDLTPEQRKVESKRMAVYAAMVESMDREIGRVLAYLEQIGERDNTFIFFMSDNGADGNTAADVGATRAWIKAKFDNSVANTGRANSYVDYGPGWAQVGSTPLRLYKAFQYEGGIAVPALAILPKAVAGQGPSAGGRTSQAFLHTMDVAPTLLELAGAKHPGTVYEGRPVVPLMGKSMLALLTGQVESIHAPDHVTGWELQGRKALRKGNWKIVYSNPPWGTGRWELFDLARDRAELNDLSAQHPEKVQELAADYERWAERTGALDLTKLAEEVGYSNGRNYYEDFK